nr:40S ribosomal protein S10B [Cryptomonas curvata]
MIISKKERELVYNEIFRVGVLVVRRNKKKLNIKEENKINNIIVIKILKGLLSKGLITETFSWKVYYFTLNDKGIIFLRKFLNIPPTVVPMTCKNPIQILNSK